MILLNDVTNFSSSTCYVLSTCQVSSSCEVCKYVFFVDNLSGGGGGGPNNNNRCFALQLEHQTKDETTRGQIRLALVFRLFSFDFVLICKLFCPLVVLSFVWFCLCLSKDFSSCHFNLSFYWSFCTLCVLSFVYVCVSIEKNVLCLLFCPL